MKDTSKTTTKSSDVQKKQTVPQKPKTAPSQARSKSVDQHVYLQRAIGNQTIQRLHESGAIQAKLTIGQPNDKYEQEADRIADQVMRMPEPQVQRQEDEEEEQIQRKPLAEQITPLVQRQIKPEEEEEEEKLLQTKEIPGQTPEVTPSLEFRIQALKGGGQPLPKSARAFFEPRFGRDFSQVRVHNDSQAAKMARVLNAKAFTTERNVVFGSGQYAPKTREGILLLAHELAHTVQQSGEGEVKLYGGEMMTNSMSLAQKAEVDTDQAPANFVEGRRITNSGCDWPVHLLQRKADDSPPVGVRSPVLEELVAQGSVVTTYIGRPLSRDERELGESVFGHSIDYSRVRLVPTAIYKLEGKGIANTITILKNFTITNSLMAEHFIHELTHIWQYQHGGTSYMSLSLASQVASFFQTGKTRLLAYRYEIRPENSFFDFTPEQQASIVQNYFRMLQDRNRPRPLSGLKRKRYISNHMSETGAVIMLPWPERQAEIDRELPLHEPLIKQMRSALPLSETEILTLRAMEVIRIPHEEIYPVTEELRPTPLKPVLEIRW